jgi:dsRNA-specific ribonuclease
MSKRFKTGGRSKGTPNKTTLEIRQILTDILSNNIDSIQNDLKHLQPKERIKVLIDISRLVLPQLKAEDTSREFIEQPLFNGIDLNVPIITGMQIR